MAKTTINDVAARAGVSKSTVSNFFNQPNRLSEATRTRIRAVIDEMAFVPNDAARQLRAGTNPVVGYIAFELSSAFTPAIAHTIERKVAQHGMHMLMANDDGSSDREHSYIELFEMQRVSGLIIAPIGDIEDQLLALKRRGTPTVLSARLAKSPYLASASANGAVGGYLAVRHLIETGRRRLAFVTSSLGLQQMSDRMQGALRAVEETPGATLEIIQVPERSVSAGVHVAAALAARPADARPDGLFCANDLLAIGVVQHLTANTGLRVPQELAVIGYDDIDFAESTVVPLSTIHVSPEALGAAAVELLFEEIAMVKTAPDGRLPDKESRHVLFEPALVVRASTA